MEFTSQTRRLMIEIARQTILAELGGSAPPLPFDDAILHEPAGCFVSIHNRATHGLRGCIGLLDSGLPLLQTLISSAKSVLTDPRFTKAPITLGELPTLEIELTIMGPMRKAENCLAFDLLRDGIQLTIDHRHGLFLPQVARETGWSREQLLSRLCTEKMSLKPNAWRSPAASLQIFSVEVVGPEPFADTAGITPDG
jgi:AmmeMemoRadiSam system protein A